MHSHLIPGIDDGSPSMEVSLRYLSALAQLGYQKIITTPHILSDLYPNTSTGIRNGLAALQQEVQAQGIGVQVEAASEYFVDQWFEHLLNQQDVLSFGSSNYVLIEMSFVTPSPQLEQAVFTLQTMGYQPILAHPERYGYWHDVAVKRFQHLKELGCLLQLNVPSLMGYYGPAIKKVALSLIKAHLVDFWGTDLHHDRHLELLTKHQFDVELHQLLDKYPLLNTSI
ncbi:MAG: CpsB/CapC family capsule biosynthesis tyrosine phosphatase [Spirosomataceae bacterium]